MGNAAKKLAPTRGVPITDPAFVPEYNDEGIITNDPDCPVADERPSRPRRRRAHKPRGLPLSALRKGAGVPQTELAERAGMLQPQVSKIEASGEELQVSTLRRYIEAIGGKLEIHMSRPEGGMWKITL